jgi:hypothetical protein
MENAELEKLRLTHKAAVERWIDAIRFEENLATPDHSMVAVEDWEKAGFAEEESRDLAKAARKEYEDGLREVLFDF